MPKLSVSQAREGLSETVSRVQYRGERVVLERHGKAVAALVPIEDYRLLEEIEDKIDLDAARKALRERGKNIPYEDLRKKLGL